jgi:hypothetical protein
MLVLVTSLAKRAFPAQAIPGLYLDRAEADNRVAAEWMSLTLKTTLLCPGTLRHSAVTCRPSHLSFQVERIPVTSQG